MLNIAVRAARAAGDIIMRALDTTGALQVDEKGKDDFVSEVDRRAEQEIIHIIHKAYPSHSILAEESGFEERGEFTWIIDPLDGTTNFLHGFPQFAVSIALKLENVLQQAVIYDPVRQELFTASNGSGAMLNNRRIRVSRQTTLKGALLGTGFPFKSRQNLDAYLDMFRVLFEDSSGIRRAGAASLDLAYVAAGRLDGFWEIGLGTWDFAAGALLIQEAGGVITDFHYGHDYFRSGNIVAGNPKIHRLMYDKIQPLLTPALGGQGD